MPGEGVPSTHIVGDWVADDDGNGYKGNFLTLLGFKLRPLSRPVYNQSLYWLHFPGSGMLVDL